MSSEAQGVQAPPMRPEWKDAPRTVLRGVGQVMFQDSAWTGLLFLAGIFWGAYAEGSPLVGWGALCGVVSATLAGYLLHLPDQRGAQGLWGFNGALVGCAFPTFFGPMTVWAWLALVLCAAMTTWVRSAYNNIMAPWNANSLTFPFVSCTWIFLLAGRLMTALPHAGLPDPALAAAVAPASEAVGELTFEALVVAWLKGISEVFLINSWVTGLFFLAALAVCSVRAAVWAAIASALSLFTALVMGVPAHDAMLGMYGFSAVLTGIALGQTFVKPGWRCTVWALTGIVATVFVQAAMNALLAPVGIPTLTGPFCVTTWLFLIPAYKWLRP